MGYYRKAKKKINGQVKYYPQSVTTGKPITTKKVAERLAKISTVSYADVMAVLGELAGVMADYMALGKTVKLDGLGTFYYTITASGNGVDTPDEVNANLITGVRVRFIPEATRAGQNGSPMTRSLVSGDIEWEEWRGTEAEAGNTETPGGGTGGEDEEGSFG